MKGPDTPTKKIFAIINSIAGVGSKKNIPKLLARISNKVDCTLTICFTEYAGHATILTKEALEQGAHTIIAVGGDGTVNEIAKAMINSKAILGIIPKGSGNGLARELQIPMDTKKAIDIIINSNHTTIDCCKANEKIFFCTCGVGFDAAVSQKFANQTRRGSISYIKNTIEEYLSYQPETYELLLPQKTLKEKAFLVACGNASQYGNNAYIAPHADLRDGELDITILSPFTPLDIPPLSIQLFTKQITHNSKIKTFRSKEFSIIRKRPGYMHLDGEPVLAEARIDISVIPLALNVYIPKAVSLKKEVRNLFDQASRFFDEKMPYIFR